MGYRFEGGGGRVAEAMFIGDISAGASDDINRATGLARQMITELGMSEVIGPINYAERQGSDFLGTELGRSKMHSEETAREIDQEVQRVLREAYQTAEDLLKANREGAELVTQALMHYETIYGEEIERLLAGSTTIETLRPPKPEPAQQEEAPKRSEPVQSDDRTLGTDRTDDLPGEAGLSPA